MGSGVADPLNRIHMSLNTAEKECRYGQQPGAQPSETPHMPEACESLQLLSTGKATMHGRSFGVGVFVHETHLQNSSLVSIGIWVVGPNTIMVADYKCIHYAPV